MDKQAQIGSTITWFVAIITIFLILIIFLVFSGAIAAQKISWNDMIFGAKNSTGEESPTTYFNFRGAVVFLESPYEQTIFRKYASSAFLNPLDSISQIFSDVNCYNACANYYPNTGESCVGKSAGITLDKRITILLVDLNKKALPDAFTRTNKIKFGANYGC